MANRKNILIGTLVVGAAIALLIKPSAAPRDQGRVGTDLLTQAQAAAVTSVEISDGADKKIKLAKDGNGSWTLEDGFPADGNRIGQLLDSVMQEQVARRIGKDKSNFAIVGLDKPTGTLTLKSGDKIELALKIGAPRPGGGIYVAIGDSDESYLLDKGLNVQATSDSWELKALANLDDKALKSVEFVPAPGSGKDPVTLTRAEPVKAFEVDNMNEGEQKNEPTATAVQSLLTQLQYSKRYPIASGADVGAMEKPILVKATRYDGATYQIQVGKTGEPGSEKWFMRLAVSGPEGKAAEAARDTLLNGLGQKWIFEVPSYTAGKFDKGRADFLIPPAKPSAG
jgi:hypothetical protein